MTASTPPLRPRPPLSRGASAIGLLAWLLLVFSASGGAMFVSIDDWYARLAKPAWNPPSWVFGPVWSALYVAMAVAAWRVWRRGGWPAQRIPLCLFLLQWLLNALWTPIFFGLHRPGLAFVEIILLLAAIVITLRAFSRVDRIAAALLLPYLAWVSFAAVLNGTIWWMNL